MTTEIFSPCVGCTIEYPTPTVEKNYMCYECYAEERLAQDDWI